MATIQEPESLTAPQAEVVEPGTVQSLDLALEEYLTPRQAEVDEPGTVQGPDLTSVECLELDDPGAVLTEEFGEPGTVQSPDLTSEECLTASQAEAGEPGTVQSPDLTYEGCLGSEVVNKEKDPAPAAVSSSRVQSPDLTSEGCLGSEVVNKEKDPAPAAVSSGIVQNPDLTSEGCLVGVVVNKEKDPTPAAVSSGIVQNSDLTSEGCLVSGVVNKEKEPAPAAVSSGTVQNPDRTSEGCLVGGVVNKEKDPTPAAVASGDENRHVEAPSTSQVAETVQPQQDDDVDLLSPRTEHTDPEVEEKRQKLMQRVSKLLEVEVKLEKQIEDSKKRFSAMRQMAKDKFDSFRNALDKRYRELRQDIANCESTMTAAETLNQFSDDVTSSMAVLEHATATATKDAMMEMMDSLTTKVDALEKQMCVTKTCRVNPGTFLDRSSEIQKKMEDDLNKLEFVMETANGLFEEVNLDTVKAQMGKDYGAAEGTFQFTLGIDEIRNMKTSESKLSPPCMVRHLPWHIKIMKRMLPKTRAEYMSVFLLCNAAIVDKTKSWSCNAKAELRILKSNSEVFKRSIEHRFSDSTFKDWGYGLYVTHDDLLDPEKNLVKDGKVTVEIFFKADVPEILEKSAPPGPLLLNSGKKKGAKSKKKK